MYQILLFTLPFLFVLGVIFGSYLNVLIYRGSFKKSFEGRSYCVSCKKTLRWHELIPIISFLILRGKCSGCGAKISLQYPIVEILSGVIFIIPILASFNIHDSILFVMTSYLLLGISVYDIEHHEILEVLLRILLVVVAVNIIYEYVFFNNYYPLIYGVLLAMPYYLIAALSKERAMGIGDSWIALPIGALFSSFLEVVSVFLLSFWIGVAIIFVIYILQIISKGKKFSIGTAIPFAPFLTLSYIWVSVFGSISFELFALI